VTPDAPQTANSAQSVILMRNRKVRYACSIISYHVRLRSCPRLE